MLSKLTEMLSKLNKKTYIIALGVILILGAAGFAYYKMVAIPAQLTNAAKLASQNSRTAVAQLGDLTLYARGTGTLIARDEINLGFGASGPISKLNVRIGDKVHKGDVLAVEGFREVLEAAVAANQISVLNAKTALQSLQENSAVATAQAQLDLANATAALNTAKHKWRVLQQGYQASSFMSNTAQAAMVLATNELKQARIAFNHVSTHPSRALDRAQAQLNLAAAQQKYDSAARQLAWVTGEPSEIQKKQLDAEVALAEAHLAQAQRTWEKVKNGADPDQVLLAQFQLANAEANLALSKRNLEASVITAPIDGTVLSITAKVGDDGLTPFISIADLNQRYLTISLDATNIEKISAGYKVEVIFDALPNQIFTGSIIQLDPNLYTPTGEKITTQTPGQITMVKGLASLDESAMTATINLPLGMTATVDVIGGQAKAVVLIPIEALHKQSLGKYTVFVMENGKQVLRPVEVGFIDSAYAEIKSGLKVGEIVVTSASSSK